MPEGFLSGLLGGLAGGFADATWEKHQQDIKQDMAQKEMSLKFIQEAINSPNFRPEFLPVAFEQIQQIISAKPGTKKGKSQQGGAMGAFTGMMNPKPSAEQVKQVDPTGRRDRYQQEIAETGTSPRGFSPIPGVDSMFDSPQERASTNFQQQVPLLNKKAEIDAANDERTRQRQLDLEAERTRNRLLRDKEIKDAKENLSINQMKNALMAKYPDMSEAEAKQAAGEQIMQVQADKHQRFESQARDIESKIVTRRERTETYLRLADSLIANREFSQRATPLKAVIAAASRDMSSAEAQVRLLTAKRAGLMQAASGPQAPAMQESINAQLRDLDQQLEAAHQAHQNAVDAVQNAANGLDGLATGAAQGGLPPVPSAKPGLLAIPIRNKAGVTVQPGGKLPDGRTYVGTDPATNRPVFR